MATTKKKTTRKTSAKKTARKASKKTAGGGNPKMDWLIDFMQKNPNAVYADAAAAATKAGHKIFPIMWGRAGVMLGRVKQKARGEGKKAKAVAKRGPGRPRKDAAPRPKAPVSARGRKSAGLSIPVASSELASMQALVDALNGGATASLRYAGGGWELTAE